MAATAGTVWAAAGLNLAVTALVATIATVTLQNQWSAAIEDGKQSAQLGTLIEQTTRIENDTNLLEIRTADIERKIVLASMNVGNLMAQAGIPIDKDVELVSIGNEIVAFPQTTEALELLETRKWERLQLTPAVGGFALDDASAGIVRAAIANAVGTQMFVDQRPATISPPLAR